MIETAMIGFLVLLYSGQVRQANMFAAFYSVVVYMVFNGIIPISVLWNLQVANLPIVVCGKVSSYKKLI